MDSREGKSRRQDVRGQFMLIRIEPLVGLVLAERSTTSHYHEPAFVLGRAGIQNPVRFLRGLHRRGIIVPTGNAVDAGSPIVRRWARPAELYK